MIVSIVYRIVKILNNGLFIRQIKKKKMVERGGEKWYVDL